MIILVCGDFPIYEHGVKVGSEFVASHGVDSITLENVIVPQEHPESLGAKFDRNIGEWVLYD